MRNGLRSSRICERFNAKSAAGETDFELICYTTRKEPSIMTQKIEHRIDDLGRVLLPTELRKYLDWDKGDVLSIHQENGKVIMELTEKYYDGASNIPPG